MVTFQSRSIQIKISDYFEEIAFQWLTNTEKKYIHSSLESRGATILALLMSRNNNEKNSSSRKNPMEKNHHRVLMV